MEHTNVLQDWRLIVELIVNPQLKDISLATKETLSELFLESVHQILTGLTSKVRQFSRRVNEVDLSHHKLIADEIYPILMGLLAKFRKQPVIASNILKIAIKIKPEYLSDDHIKDVEQFLQSFLKLFVYYTDTDALTALLDFLVLVNEHIPRLNTASRNTVEDLKKYVSEQLYKSFKSKDRHTLQMARKTAITFGKFDLNDHIEWGKLLVSWDILDSNVEYIEDVMKSCHWSLIWYSRRLSSTHMSKKEQNKEAPALTRMAVAFFELCSELVDKGDRNIQFKAFERVCETKLALCPKLENISREIRTLGDLNEIKDEAVQNQIMNIFERSVGTVEDSVAKKYAMYIVNMAFLNILPFELMSIIFKYYNVHYDTYGKLIETVLGVMVEKDENWVPMVLVNTICICFEKLEVRHGAVVDVRSQEAKDILNLSRRFAECKKIKIPRIASKLLFYAINYAVDNNSYLFLVFVRVFINEILGNPDMRTELLDHLKKTIPKSHVKNSYVLYFGGHLAGAESKNPNVPKKPKRGRRTTNAPRLGIHVTKVKMAPTGKENVAPIVQSQTTESEVSDDMTIHDTSSDDLDVNFSSLDISNQT